MENSTLQQYEPELNNSSLSIERTYPTPLLYKQCNLIDLRLVCAWYAPRGWIFIKLFITNIQIHMQKSFALNIWGPFLIVNIY